MKVIIISGTPGTGKTTVAKKLAKEKHYEYINVANLIIKNKLSAGYDKKRKTKIIDIKKLNKFLVNLINTYKKLNIKNNKDKEVRGIIIDSHLSHYLPPKYVNLCMITKCNLKTLQKRLKKKGYHKEKIRENLDAEIFDICLNEAKELGHRIKIVYTNKKL